jgi:hypothetical protein
MHDYNAACYEEQNFGSGETLTASVPYNEALRS